MSRAGDGRFSRGPQIEVALEAAVRIVAKVPGKPRPDREVVMPHGFALAASHVGHLDVKLQLCAGLRVRVQQGHGALQVPDGDLGDHQLHR